MPFGGINQQLFINWVVFKENNLKITPMLASFKILNKKKRLDLVMVQILSIMTHTFPYMVEASSSELHVIQRYHLLILTVSYERYKTNRKASIMGLIKTPL